MSFRSIFIALAGAAFLSACSQGNKAEEEQKPEVQEVNLYTARNYESDLPLYERFTRETGIKINRIEGSAEQLIARMKSEGTKSPADLFITSDAGSLWQAQQAGLFQPVQSQSLSKGIPANLREPNGYWYGFTRRARVVAYDSAKVQPEEIDDYEKLSGPRFKGKICVRSSDSVYNLSLVGAMIEAWGMEKTELWARGIVANMARPPEGADRDQIRAVAAGVCEVAIVNSYYYIRMASGTDEADRKVTETVKLGFPSLDGKGSHVNISGGGVLVHSPNQANAIRLLEFFASADTQKHIVSYNYELPASSDVEVPEPLIPYANFKANPMSVSVFAGHQAEAQAIMSAAGWR